MTALKLTKTRFVEGHWEGILTSSVEGTVPDVQVTLRDMPLEGVTVTEIAEDTARPGPRWVVRIPVPAEAVGDGVQTILIFDAATDTVLNSVTLVAGEALGDDIRAEVELLRAELDMLKRAFRRHCLETA